MIAYIKRIKPETVIVAARWTSVLPAAEAQTRAAIETIAPYADRVLVIGPTPEMPDTAPRCISLGVDCGIERAVFDRQSAGAAKFLASIPDASLVNVAPYFCTSASCSATKAGMALYWDDHHVSSTAVHTVATAWLAGVRP